MRAAKQTLILCWIITIISLLGIVILHAEIDIGLQEQITKNEWTYDYDERDFYQSIWSNIFTGAIVSLLMTYVSYGRAKHDLEFQLKASEQTMAMLFNNMTLKLYYDVNLSHPLFEDNNRAAIRRFESDISIIKSRYDKMVEASNDYSPFFLNKKSRNLMHGKRFLQDLWVDICPVEDSILISKDETDIKKAIDTARQKVVAKENDLKVVADSIKDY